MRLSRSTCRALTALLLVGIPALGQAAVTVTVKDGSNTTVCTPTSSSLSGNCGSKLRLENSGGTARVAVDDNNKDLVSLTNVKIIATQPISNYTIVIQVTGLATPPEGAEVWYKTAVKGQATQSASFNVSTQVTNSNGTTTYALTTSPTITGGVVPFDQNLPARQVNPAISGPRNITMKLKILTLGQHGYINIGNNYFKIQNQDAPDCAPDSTDGNCSEPIDPQEPRSPALPLEEIIKASGREACLGIYSPMLGCYGVYIK